MEPKMFRSGELARLSGVSPDTLRYYERVGLLPLPRRAPNGYREYTASALDRVLLIQRALEMGFNLEELKRILAARDRGALPCGEVRRLASQKLGELDARLIELASLRDQLQKTIQNWDSRLAATPQGKPARLLESLGAPAESGRSWFPRNDFRRRTK